MRKLVKFCLAMAMVGAMAAPAMAEDGVKSGFTGQAGAFYSSSKKSYDTETIYAKDRSTTEIQTDSQIGGKVTVTKGEWVSEVKAQFDADGYGNGDNTLDLSDTYVSLSNGDISVKAGYFFVGGVTKGVNDWGWTAVHTDTFKFGEDAGLASWSRFGGTNEDFGLFARNQNIKVSLDKLGAWVSYAAWKANAHTDTTVSFDVEASDGTETHYNNNTDDYSALRAGYNGKFGMIDLGVQYTSFAIKGNEDSVTTGSGSEYSNDGFLENEISIGVGLSPVEGLNIGVNFEKTDITYHKDADNTAITTYQVAGSYNLGEMGTVGGSYGFRDEETLSRAYDATLKTTVMTNNKNDDNAKTTMITLNWQKWINATNVFVHYLDKDVKDDPSKGDYKYNEMGIGMLQFF